MESVHYPDIWAPLPGGSVEKVLVDLVLAEADPWAAEALVAKAAIEKQFGGTIEVRVSGPTGPVALALGVRATPTWAVAGYRMRGAQSAAALARLIDRELKEYR
jgi:protein-disulfide isomerase